MTSGAKPNATGGEKGERDDEERVPPTYMAISGCCGDMGTSHMPDCKDKNCCTYEVEHLVEQGKREESGVDLIYNVHTVYKAETLAQIRLGRRFCSVLRFRAKAINLPINTVIGWFSFRQLSAV